MTLDHVVEIIVVWEGVVEKLTVTTSRGCGEAVDLSQSVSMLHGFKILFRKMALD